MSSPLIVPIFQFPIQPNAASTAGYQLLTSAAGTSTLLPTYTDSTLTVANTNPVIMNAQGQANIWLGNAAYKFTGMNAVGATLWTADDVTQASLGQTGSEWISFDAVPTFISATSFSLLSIPDLTASPYFIGVGSRIRTVNTGGTIYSTVTAVSLSTLTVKNDSGVIDSGISSASYGIISGTNSSVARQTKVCYVAGSAVTLTNAANAVLNSGGSLVVDYLNEMSGAVFTAKTVGSYRVWGSVLYNEQAATTGIQNVGQGFNVLKNGSTAVSKIINWIPAASIASSQSVEINTTINLIVNDTISIAVLGVFTGTAPTANLLSLNIDRVL